MKAGKKKQEEEEGRRFDDITSEEVS